MEGSESAATERRHFAFLLSLAEEASHYEYQAEKPWLDRLEVEHDNFRAALAWSLRNKEAELGLHLAGTLAWFWRKRFYRREGRVWLEKMLANSTKTPSASLAKALYFAGLLISDLGDNHQAKRLTEQAVTVARTVGDEATIAWSLTVLGHITRIVDGGRQSAVLHEEALNLFRELGDGWGVNDTLRNLGRAVLQQHDTERAAMLLEEALGLARVAGVQINIAYNLCLLGNIACHQNNNPGRAGVLFQESLSLFQEVQDIWGITESFLGLASVARMQRDYEQARRFYKESLATMNSTMGYNYSVAEAIWGLGAVARAEGDYKQAQTLYQEALILNKGLDTWDTAYCLAGLGGLEIGSERTAAGGEAAWGGGSSIRKPT